jgi:hypothetical protein
MKNIAPAIMLIAILAGGCVCQRHTAASHAESSTKPSIVRGDIEWSRAWVPGINHTDKPHILLIGDSITEAYSSVVENQFGKFLPFIFPPQPSTNQIRPLSLIFI